MVCALFTFHRHRQWFTVDTKLMQARLDEEPDRGGIAHFCEHATFKGTQRRDSLDIIRCLENVGGDLNAYTTKTTTVYHSAILSDQFPLAVDLLSDIVLEVSIHRKK